MYFFYYEQLFTFTLIKQNQNYQFCESNILFLGKKTIVN